MSDIAELRDEFFRRLRPVRGRLRVAQMLAAIQRAIPVAASIGIGLCALRLANGYPSAWIVAAAALAPIALAPVWGITRTSDRTVAARAIDRQYGLADRSLSALENLRQNERDLILSPIAELQVRDAVGHLQPVRARDVVQLRISRRNLGLLATLVGLLLGSGVARSKNSDRDASVTVRQADNTASPAPVVTSSPFDDLPAERLKQPTRVGRAAGPLAAEERRQESYLGDNAAVERYFELMDRNSMAPDRPR